MVKRFWFECLVSNSSREEIPLEHSRELLVFERSKKSVRENLEKRFKHFLIVKKIDKVV